MTLTVTEAQAVVVLLDWLADKPRYAGSKTSDAEATSAMIILGEAAGRRLQLSPDTKVPALIVERLRAADSDGAAQAACRAMDLWDKNGYGQAPGPIARPLDEWRRLQDTELGERLREQTADRSWGTVDV